MKVAQFILIFLFPVSLLADPPPPPHSPTVSTRSVELYGPSGATLNGSIHPNGRLTSYYFEYGLKAGKTQKSKETILPPRLAAFYREDWDEGAGGWRSWGAVEHFKTDGLSKGFIRSSEPANHDHNHDTGLGSNHLTNFIFPGLAEPSIFLGGGEPDLRDAKIGVTLRGNNWKPKGTELVWWSQCQMNPEPITRFDWARANWAYTGFLMTDYLSDGKWHNVEYRLRNDSRDWSYAGGRRRYQYGSIDQCQRSLNYDLFHMIVFVDPNDPPEGSIDFDSFEIAYRNYSLLLPSNGGRLEKSPEGDWPGRLVDGWRNGEGRMWRSSAKPKTPLEFVYSFVRPVVIRKVQLHQNTEWPSKDVEVLTSTDGKNFESLLSKVMPNSNENGPNWTFTIDQNLSRSAKWLKVVLKSGYKDEHWGLGEIEVFGSGAEMWPDDEMYFLNTDIGDLELGKEYQYRLVAVQDGKTFPGEFRAFQTPQTKEPPPNCEAEDAYRITQRSASLAGRINPQSKATRFHFEYGTSEKFDRKTKPRYGGLEMTFRLVVDEVAGLKAKTKYYYRLVAESAAGTCRGETRTFSTP